MKKHILFIFVALVLSGCSKDETEDYRYNEKLVGKEYLRDFNALLNYSIEFTSNTDLRYVTKNKGSNTVNEGDSYRYFKWEKSGITGMDIEVTIPADENFPERKIKGYLTETTLTFTEIPLKGAYDLRQ